MKTVTIINKKKLHKGQLYNDDELKKFRTFLGQLRWFAGQCRPGLLLDLCLLSSSVYHCTIKELVKLNEVLEKAKKENFRY